MVATCTAGTIMYVLPMLLGRTYDLQHDKVGIDIYEQKYIDNAVNNPKHFERFDSSYMTLENSNEKRDFLGISGELGLKIGAGLIDLKGSGEYLKDTSNLDNSIEVLVKMTFITTVQEIDPDSPNMEYWKQLDRKSVGTSVVTSLTFGGEVYASVNFVAHNSEDFENITGEIKGSISKSGAFDLDAQGKLSKVAQKISSKAKMEISYYSTVPLETVPTTLEGLSKLVQNFQNQTKKVNNGLGVPVCAGLRPLSDFDKDFTFLKNKVLLDDLNELSERFDNLRESKALLRNLVNSLPELVNQTYMDKIIDFSDRLTDTLRIFHSVIGNLDLEQNSTQLEPANTAFTNNSNIGITNTRYTKEVRALAEELKITEDPNKPRGVYVRWGRTTCGVKSSNGLYVGYMASFFEQGLGGGTSYECLPKVPNLKSDLDFEDKTPKTASKIAAVRFHSMSVFKNEGKHIENKIPLCTVCETLMRPTVEMYPAMLSCPGGWIQEYTGFLVSYKNASSRVETVCVDYDPEIYDQSTSAKNEPVVLPVMMGTEIKKSLPCVVCSK